VEEFVHGFADKVVRIISQELADSATKLKDKLSSTTELRGMLEGTNVIYSLKLGKCSPMFRLNFPSCKLQIA